MINYSTQTVDTLLDEWEECEACALGTHRRSVNGRLVRGEGHKNAVMFIGEGPGVEEEASGRPFVGKSGEILRQVLQRLNFTDFYITNTVICRACTPLLDPQGAPRLRRGLPIYKDEKPLPTQIDACKERLYSEIYLVDPVVIVTLGATAAEALLRRPISITKERGKGNEAHIEVPGATHRPILTDKRNAWLRKSGGQLHAPIERSSVRYLMVPTLHPAYVARQIADRGPKSAFQQFVSDIKYAKSIYDRYRLEAFGEEAPAEVSPELEYDHSYEDYDEE